MKSSARKVELASVDDLFTTEENRQDAAREKVMEIPLGELFPFPDHPFSVRDDDTMKETVESVKEYPPLENVPPRYAIVRRNEWMVRESGVVISGVTHEWGGAAKMLDYARRKQKVIVQYPTHQPQN